jgi:hypothetical protein
MIQISQEDRSHYKKVLAETKQLKPDTYRRRDSANAEDLKTLHKLYRQGRPFFITGVVSSPYDGCMYEPNIWLVTPVGCEQHGDLNSTWRPRYADPKGRQAALAEVSERGHAIWKAKWDLERAIEPHRELLGGGLALKVENPDGTKTLDDIAEEMQNLCLCADLLRFIEEEVEPELQAEDKEKQAEIESRFPPLPEPPDSIVWPLYASGQGVAVDTIYTFTDLVDWLAEGQLPAGDRQSRLTRDKSWFSRGSFDSFDVRPWGPVSAMNPAEHYWGHAVRAAQEKWEIDLPWCCDKCGHEVEGTDESGQAPHFTGYRGNGGIGVFMEGALCDDCFDAGQCDVCRHGGGDDHETYDIEVADMGASLCEWHTEVLLKDALHGTPEAISLLESLPDTHCLELEPVLLNAGQVFLPGFKPEPDVGYLISRRVPLEGPVEEYGVDWTLEPIAGLELDAELIREREREMDLELYTQATVVELGGDRKMLKLNYCRGLTLLAEHVNRSTEEIEGIEED